MARQANAGVNARMVETCFIPVRDDMTNITFFVCTNVRVGFADSGCAVVATGARPDHLLVVHLTGGYRLK